MNQAREHIICVDDEEGILNALRQQLNRYTPEWEISLAKSGKEALELIEALEQDKEPVAMVIADQIMPGIKGSELLEEVHKRHPQSVKILLTGQASFEALVRAVNAAGLDRFIPKPWDEADLRVTVQSLLDKYRLAQENQRLLEDLRQTNAQLVDLNEELERRVQERTAKLEAANKRLNELAITDGLTGRYNHRYFQERFALEVERSRRHNLPLSLMMADVDHFKQYNDRYGHPAGDTVLRAVADQLAMSRRANDIIARYGGEEFALLLPDTPKDAAMLLADQLRQQVAEMPVETSGSRPLEQITISIGVASYPDDASDAESLLNAADRALYHAKHDGRNCVRGFDKTRAE